MDLRLLFRLISRFWYIALVGAVLAVAATIFSVARLDTSNWQLKYRQQLQYTSTSVLLVDGNRPSWLYAVPPGTAGITATATDTANSSIADPARLGGLTSLYGYFVQSDAVRKLTGDAPINSVSSQTITADVGNGRREPLPLLAVIATGGSPAAATNLARRVTHAFQLYVRDRQTQAHVSDQDRVTLQVVNAPSPGTLVAPRSYTRAIVAGLLTLIATIGLMLLIANLRPAGGSSPAAGGTPLPNEPRPLRARPRTSTTGGVSPIATMDASSASASAHSAEPGRRLAPPG